MKKQTHTNLVIRSSLALALAIWSPVQARSAEPMEGIVMTAAAMEPGSQAPMNPYFSQWKQSNAIHQGTGKRPRRIAMKKDLLIEAAIYVSCLSLVSLLLQEPVVARSPGFVLASNTSSAS